MNRIIENFIKRSQEQRHKHRVFILILCVLSMVVSAGVTWWLRLPGLTLSGDPKLNTSGVTEFVADEVTWDNWKDRFGAEVNSTRFAGAVWTDKSVTVGDLTSSSHSGITFEADKENFLVGLSAIGSTVSIKGEMKTPTDTMIILDISSSMYNSGSATAVQNMVTAVNNAINTLFTANTDNRVGVVAYFGGGSVNSSTPSTEAHVKVFLPLDRYEKKTNYLTVGLKDGKLNTVSSDATNLKGERCQESHTVSSPAGTYMQLGLLKALEQFRGKINNNDTTVKLANEQIVTRQPVFIFMTDGVATAANTDFSDSKKELIGSGDYSAEWGLNSNAWRSREESDFVTQLTASYAKEEVTQGYYGTENTSHKALFYSMGFFSDEGMKTAKNNADEVYFSEDVVQPNMNPTAESSSATIKGWWEKLIKGEEVSFTVYTNNSAGWAANKFGNKNGPSGTATEKVNQTDLTKGGKFPTNIEQLNYVDNYYSSGSSTDFTTMFDSIITDVSEKIGTSPTYVTSNNNQEGHVTFVDNMNSYMEVKKIEGIVLNNKLYTGWELAQNFTDDGESVFGTIQTPTAYGNEFFFNVIEQLGINDLPEFNDPDKTEEENRLARNVVVQDLIRKAYNAEQLKGVSETEFSNYVGWYATADNTYLGFWNDKNYGSSDNPDAKGDYTPVPSNAKYGIKSYFLLYRLSTEESSDTTADLMYVNVQIRTELATGEQDIVFAVPASVLPTEHYEVELDENRNVKSIKNDIPATFHPIRLVYRVGLDEGLDASTLASVVDAEYIEQNITANGEVRFYSNDWARNKAIGYNTPNTYSYFRPSFSNDRYYYTSNATLYTDETMQNKYTGSDKPTATDGRTYYTKHTYYENENGTYKVKYYTSEVSEYALGGDFIQKADDGSWYIKSGVPHGLPQSSIDKFSSWKTDSGVQEPSDAPERWNNITETLDIVNMPYVDTQSVNANTAKPFIMGATLGNNGRLALIPNSEHKIQKILTFEDGTPYTASKDMTVQFLIHEGDALADYSSGAGIWNELNTPDVDGNVRKATIVTATVRAGESASDVVSLKKSQIVTLGLRQMVLG